MTEFAKNYQDCKKMTKIAKKYENCWKWRKSPKMRKIAENDKNCPKLLKMFLIEIVSTMNLLGPGRTLLSYIAVKMRRCWSSSSSRFHTCIWNAFLESCIIASVIWLILPNVMGCTLPNIKYFYLTQSPSSKSLWRMPAQRAVQNPVIHRGIET